MGIAGHDMESAFQGGRHGKHIAVVDLCGIQLSEVAKQY
jgi:hypothetical protein